MSSISLFDYALQTSEGATLTLSLASKIYVSKKARKLFKEIEPDYNVIDILVDAEAGKLTIVPLKGDKGYVISESNALYCPTLFKYLGITDKRYKTKLSIYRNSADQITCKLSLDDFPGLTDHLPD